MYSKESIRRWVVTHPDLARTVLLFLICFSYESSTKTSCFPDFEVVTSGSPGKNHKKVKRHITHLK